MLGYGRFALIDKIRDTSTLVLFRQLESIQFESPTKIRERQERSLDDYFLALTAANPFYSNYLSFSQLPVIDKAFANGHREQLMNPDYSGKYVRKKTGGSTGEPFVYFTGTLSQSYLWASILLSWRAAGYQLGEPVAFLAGSSLFGTGLKQAIYYKLMNVTVLSAFDLSSGRMQAYVEAIASGGFRLLYGYASAIHRLAQYLIAAPIRPRFNLRGVVCTAEVLTPAMRQTIEMAFGVICLNQYGCHEAGVSAYECEYKQGLHLVTTRCYPEIQEDGRFISTDLANYAFFLPRYDTGDLIVMDDASCSCGRGFPLIREVIGRSNDLVSDQAGNVVHSEFFSHMFREDSRIVAFQILYDERKLLVNLHCPETRCDWSDYLNRTRETFTFDYIDLVENMPFVVPANGKHRFVMRVDDVEAYFK